MKMKRYFAPDMRQALRKVREDQGPDAVILSNRQVDGGVEIIAAVDYDQALVNRALGLSGGRRTKRASRPRPVPPDYGSAAESAGPAEEAPATPPPAAAQATAEDHFA